MDQGSTAPHRPTPWGRSWRRRRSSFTPSATGCTRRPPLGALVKSEGDAPVYGVVAEVTTRSIDPGRRSMAMGEDDPSGDAVYERNPQLARLLATEFRATVVGHRDAGRIRRYLAPLPPRIHDFVFRCADDEAAAFSEALDFLPLLLERPPWARLTRSCAAFLRRASLTHTDPEAFLLRAGKELAPALGGQFQRLSAILKAADAVNDAPDIAGDREGARLGVVVGGSLTEGVDVRLDGDRSTEDVKVGTFVSIQGDRSRFLGVVTDVSLETTDSALRASPPDVSDPFVAEVVSGTSAYGTIRVEPMLVIDVEGPTPAKTVPSHFAAASTASQEDIEIVFGAEDERHFWIGSPLDMETRLCLDMRELVKRSNGVFGKSGTGKTFLTRLLLAGILQSGEATNLVFDMESEYGWRGYSEANLEVKGLKQLFPSKVAVFSLDEESSRRRGLTPDYVVRDRLRGGRTG